MSGGGCILFTASKPGFSDREPFGVPIDMAPAIGKVGDERAWYSLGCVGHGVALTHLNGQTLADLVLEKKIDPTSIWFVNRRTLPWPPEPLRWAASQALFNLLVLVYNRPWHTAGVPLSYQERQHARP